MLKSNEGKFVRFSTCGNYVLVVFSKPPTYHGNDYMFYVLQQRGTLEQYGSCIFSKYEQGPNGQQMYYGNEAPTDVVEKFGAPKLLYLYQAIWSGILGWGNSLSEFTDPESHRTVKFENIPHESPLVDGAGWNCTESFEISGEFLFVRETPYYNRDIEWNYLAARSTLNSERII